MKRASITFASLVAVGLVVGAGAPAAAQEFCKVQFTPAGDGHFNGVMTVPTNSYCYFTLNGSVIDPAITRKPRNGVAEYREMKITYTPKKGFVGADELSFERSSLYAGGEVKKRTYNVKLNVVAR